MDNKLLLIRTLTLLYRESQLDNMDTSTVLANNVIKLMNLSDRAIEGDTQAEAMSALRDTVEWLAYCPGGTVHNEATMLQRIRVDVGSETYLYDIIAADLKEIPVVEIESRIISIRTELNNWVNDEELRSILKRTSGQVAFGGHSINIRQAIRDFTNEVEPYLSGVSTGRCDALVSEADTRDAEIMADIIKVGLEASSAKGSIKFGVQGINTLFGDQKGARRGDFVLIGALQHNYKSGLLTTMARGHCMYNTPYMLDNTKKPLVLFFSLENDIADNYVIMYTAIKEAETGEAVDTTDININDMIAYINMHMTSNGYHFKMLRYDPSKYTYADLTSEILYYESLGYEIHAIYNDYTNMMSKAGCSGKSDEAKIRDLFRRIRNFTGPRKISYFTAHQLSPAAKQLIRDGGDDFVKRLPGRSYYADASGVDQEVDVEIFIHLEKPGDGSTWLTVQRGKHRKSGKITLDKDLYFVQELHAIGGLRDDIYGRALCRRSVGGPTMNGESGEKADGAWWAKKPDALNEDGNLLAA